MWGNSVDRLQYEAQKIYSELRPSRVVPHMLMLWQANGERCTSENAGISRMNTCQQMVWPTLPCVPTVLCLTLMSSHASVSRLSEQLI